LRNIARQRQISDFLLRLGCNVLTSGNDPQRFDKSGAAAETLFGALLERARQHQIEFWRFLGRNLRGRRRR
jgi:hypothetical protein